MTGRRRQVRGRGCHVGDFPALSRAKPGLCGPTALSAASRPTAFPAVFALVRWLPDRFQRSTRSIADLVRSDLGAFCCIMRLTEKEPRR